MGNLIGITRNIAEVLCIEAQRLAAHHYVTACYAIYLGSFAVAKVEQHKARLQHERAEIWLSRLLRMY